MVDDPDSSLMRRRCQYCRCRFSREELAAHELSCEDNTLAQDSGEDAEGMNVPTCKFCSLGCESDEILSHETNCVANPENMFLRCKEFKVLLDTALGVQHANLSAEITEWLEHPLLQGQVQRDLSLQALIGCGLAYGSRTIVAVVGQVGCGKSSVIDCLMGRGGGELDLENMNLEPGNHFNKLRSRNYNYTLIDTRTDDIKSVLDGISMCDCVLFLIDVTKDFNTSHPRDDYLQHGLLAISMRVNQLICCFNKMDMVLYSKDVYLTLKRDVTRYFSYFGYDVMRIRFLPISAYRCENIVSSSNKLEWYSGFTLFEELERLDQYSKVSKELRIVVDLVSEQDSMVIISGCVHSGKVEKGRCLNLKFGPGLFIDVDTVSVDRMLVEEVWPGEAVELRVGGPINFNISRGNVASEWYMEVDAAVSVDVEILVVDLKTKITPGLTVFVCFCHKAAFRVFVSKIRGVVDRMNRKNPLVRRVFLAGETIQLSLVTLERVVLEEVDDHPSMGRVVLCDEAHQMVVGVGVILKVERGVASGSSSSKPEGSEYEG